MSAAPQQAGRYSAAGVKAAFLYHFCAYVEWPAPANSADAAPVRNTLTIAIVGDSGVAEELKRILPGRRVGDRSVQVRELASSEDLAGAQILFIGKDLRTSPARLIKAASSRPILVVTEQPRGLEQGAMINFVPAEGRVRFELAPAAAQASGLKFSSRLFPVALRVREHKP